MEQELETKHDSRKSFYGKARVETNEADFRRLRKERIIIFTLTPFILVGFILKENEIKKT